MSDTLYERYNTGDDSTYLFYGVHWRGQTFTIGNTGANTNHEITSVKLKFYRLGSPGTLTVSIRAVDGDGLPTGADLTSGTTDGNTITTDYEGEWREITLTPYELSASTKYAIVIRITAGDADNNLEWKADGSSPSYTGGTVVYSSDSGASWTPSFPYDFMFEEYGLLISAAFMTPNKYW